MQSEALIINQVIHDLQSMLLAKLINMEQNDIK